MLAARLAIVERIHAVELRLARIEQARLALELLGGQAHQLGNAIQIVDLASLELERRQVPDAAELVGDIRTATTAALSSLRAIVGLARPASRVAGPPVAPVIRAAIAEARQAVASAVEVRVELDDTVTSLLARDELEALALASVLDAADAARIEIVLRERLIEGARWIELVRTDDRASATTFAAVIGELAKVGDGEASIAPGRTGPELAVALPVYSSSSSYHSTGS